MSASGQIYLLSGPPGVGKSTIAARVRRDMPDLAYSVSLTTRQSRPGEVDGQDYFFLSREEFLKRVKQGEVAEYAEIFGNLYGTSDKVLRAELDKGRDLFLDTDVDGAAQLRERFPDGVFIFLLPPDRAVLENRLRGRGTEDEAQVTNRLARFHYELKAAHDYTHVVINDDLEKAVRQVEAIITAGRAADQNRTELHREFIDNMLRD